MCLDPQRSLPPWSYWFYWLWWGWWCRLCKHPLTTRCSAPLSNSVPLMPILQQREKTWTQSCRVQSGGFRHHKAHCRHSNYMIQWVCVHCVTHCKCRYTPCHNDCCGNTKTMYYCILWLNMTQDVKEHFHSQCPPHRLHLSYQCVFAQRQTRSILLPPPQQDLGP